MAGFDSVGPAAASLLPNIVAFGGSACISAWADQRMAAKWISDLVEK
jgi:hypothetical protein